MEMYKWWVPIEIMDEPVWVVQSWVGVSIFCLLFLVSPGQMNRCETSCSSGMIERIDLDRAGLHGRTPVLALNAVEGELDTMDLKGF